MEIKQHNAMVSSPVSGVSQVEIAKPSEGGDEINFNASQTALSREGKLMQAIDETSNQVDEILTRHLSPEQKQELEKVYQALDKEFERAPSAQGDKKIDDLFEQAHQILDSSVEKLSASELKQVDGLVQKMDEMEMQLEQIEGAQVQGFNAQGLATNGSAQELIAGGDSTAKGKRKTPSVAELNSMSAAELKKLPAHLLKKLNAQQLNKLSPSQLNQLPDNLLAKLTPSNLAKVNGNSVS